MTKSLTFQFRTSQEFLDLLDEWRNEQEKPMSRSEAIRFLVLKGITE